MEATESDALDIIEILQYAMQNTIEDCYTMPKLHSDDKLTNRKVNHIDMLIYLHLYKNYLNSFIFFTYNSFP